MNVPGNPDASVVAWIRTAAIPLATVEPRQGWTDLAALRNIIGDARILSLGEATHGTREFFKLKHRIVEYCVAELGFTMVVFEANFPESLAINAYVLGGAGTAADALAGLRFWVWDTEEVLDLIEWMRWWNATHARKVKFYGYDMAYPAIAAQGLIDFLARVAPELAAACKTELAPLTSDFTAQIFGRLPDAGRRHALDCIARVLAAFEERRSPWTEATSAIDWHLARLHAIVLDQSARFAPARAYALHERAIAENVCALLEAEGPDAKAVLWSHNSHAARTASSDGNSLGKCLDEMVGRAQVVVGFSFDRGAFQARGYPTGAVMDHTVAPGAPDTFDSVLAQAGLPLFALDLVHAPRAGAAAAWLASEMPMRSIGGIYGLPKDHALGLTYTEAITPRETFDAVVFIAETTAARRNTCNAPEAPSPVLPAPSNLELMGDGVPAGWRVAGGGRKYVYTARVSDERSPRGGRTVCVSRDTAPWRWGDGQLFLKFSAQAWRGKRLKFSAAIRTEVEHVGAGAYTLVRFLPKPNPDQPNFLVGPLATAASTAAPIQSPQWATFAVEADVPDAADSVIIALAMTGNGAAWFGDLALTAIERTG